MADTDNNESILNDIKKLLGMDPDYTAFDTDVRIFINGAFSTLHQLGVGPQDKAFAITSDSNKWFEFLPDFGEDSQFQSVQTYIYLRVRLLLDPPTTSFAIDAIKEQIKELEWRLNVAAETPKPEGSVIEEEQTITFWSVG